MFFFSGGCSSATIWWWKIRTHLVLWTNRRWCYRYIYRRGEVLIKLQGNLNYLGSPQKREYFRLPQLLDSHVYSSFDILFLIFSYHIWKLSWYQLLTQEVAKNNTSACNVSLHLTTYPLHTQAWTALRRARIVNIHLATDWSI